MKETWDDMNIPQDDELSTMLKASNVSKMPSNNPLEKIKRNLLINIILGIGICLLYMVVIVYFRIWQVQICMSIVFLFSVWALYTAWVQYKRMNSTISPNNPVIEELKRHYHSITEWMDTQKRVALWIYPISALGGFMLGGASESGKSVAVFMSKPIVILALLIALAVLVPACWYLTKWMFKVSFGKHLQKLQDNIRALEEENL